MRRKSGVFWHLFPWYLLVVFIAIAAACWHFSLTMHQFHRDQAFAELTTLARVAEDELAQTLNVADETAVDAYCKHLGQLAQARFTVILPTGRVIGDSAEKPEVMDNHGTRPEVRDALAGEVGTSVRYSHTVRAELAYVALPLVREGRIAGVARTARPLTQLEATLRSVQRTIVVGGCVIALLAAAVTLAVARHLARPIERLRRGAERFAAGDLAARIAEPDAAELSELAEALNRMAEDLAARIETVTNQRNELEAILTSMAEGVLAIDRDDRVLAVNRAAADLLGLADANVQGRSLTEVVRQPALQELVGAVRQQAGPVESEIVLYGHDRERFIQVHGTALPDGRGQCSGAVFVLNDVTRLRRLESVRRDFVANVSHELRTPITSLKGFVETLLDGAKDEPETAERFLGIILKHADRLNAIVDDLLLLAQMEQTEKGQDAPRPELGETRVEDVLQGAVRFCHAKAAAKGIDVRLDCPATLLVKADQRLLEQALVNLLDNAINYSENGRPVELVGRVHAGEVLIEVRDQGCGIPKNHLSRIFERFYRVDKARSRDVGGTGLGLAIVKHIVQVHGGAVTVESEVGKGSVFALHLPA